MRNFSRLPLYFLLLFFSTLYLGVFVVSVRADNTGFLSLLNIYRQQNNLEILTEDQNLTNAACWLSSDLDINGFNHTDSKGRNMAARLNDFGVSGGYRAENIYYTTSGSSANYAFDAWKNSPGHNTNMLGSNYTRIGIGRVNVSGKWYWTTDFASGIAVSLTSQCGVVVNPPTPPAPTPAPTPKPVAKASPPPTPVAIAEQPPTQVQVATTSAGPDLKIAAKSATVSPKIIKVDPPKPNENTSASVLIKGSFFVASFLGLLTLFGSIFWKLFHHFRLPVKEHEEEI